jgi:molybdate transport system ATP-binding protein
VSARPRSRYVAELVGINLYRGRAGGHTITLAGGATLVAADDHHGEVFAAVHPHAVALHRRSPEGTPRNVWAGTAETLDAAGDRIRVRVSGPLPIVAEVTPATEVIVYPTSSGGLSAVQWRVCR